MQHFISCCAKKIVLLGMLIYGLAMPTQAQMITTVAGGGVGDGRLATSLRLDYTNGVAVDAADNLYIADNYNRIRKVSASTGIINTVAGNGTNSFSGYSANP